MHRTLIATTLLLAVAPRQVPAFKTIDHAGALTLETRIGIPQRVALEGPADAVAQIVTEVTSGVLYGDRHRALPHRHQGHRRLPRHGPVMELKADATGATDIVYLGKPKLQLNTTGASSVHAK